MTAIPWFHPFSFLVHLPFRVADVENEGDEKFAILHENVHYLQSVASYSGIFRFSQFWVLYTKVARLRQNTSDDDFNEAERSQIRIDYQEAQEQLLALEPADGIRYGIVDIDDVIANDVRQVLLPSDEKAYAFLRQIDGNVHANFFDILALQESMAFAYEVWLGRDVSAFYDQMVSSTSPDFFQYAMGIEAVKTVTNWESREQVAGLTVILCDFALNHPSPASAFFFALQIVHAEWSEEPEELPVDEIIERLETYLIIPEVLEEIARQNGFIHMLAERAKASDDQFDRATGSILEVMLLAIKLRLENPSYFAKSLLYDFGNEEFLGNFHMPAYISGKEFVDTGISPNRHEFILYIHAMHHRLSNIAAEDTDPQCPYIDSTCCGFEKNQYCQTEPWNRRFEHQLSDDIQQVCLYRFVEHSFQNPS